MDRQANIEKSIAYLAADEQVRCRIPSSPGERQRLLRALMNVWEPKELYNNREWVERVLPEIRDCRIPSEMVPHTPDGEPVAMNLRCDNTFVEDARWHEQEERYSAFVQQAADKRLLLLEFGVGFNTPVIIRMPFERMAAQLLDTTLVRFNRDYPQPYQAGIERFIPFTEDINRIISQLNIST